MNEMTLVLLVFFGLVAAVLFFWLLFRKDLRYMKQLGCQRESRDEYTQYYFFKKAFAPCDIYFFKKQAIEPFSSMPYQLYRYRGTYFATWLIGYREAEKYATVLFFDIPESTLYGHIRSPRLFESTKNYQSIECDYYLTSPQTNFGWECGTLLKIKRLTDNWQDTGWRFVFENGRLAIYRAEIMSIKEINKVFGYMMTM